MLGHFGDVSFLKFRDQLTKSFGFLGLPKVSRYIEQDGLFGREEKRLVVV